MKESIIESPTLFGNFGERMAFKGISRLVEKSDIGSLLSGAGLVADLGSGTGGSTAALRSYCNGAEIHSVDVAYSRLNEDYSSKLGANHHHFGMNFHDYFRYLINNGRKLDVALFKSVPEHQLEKQHGYQLLATALVKGGIVIEIGGTKLADEAMQEHFDALYAGDDPYYRRYIWQKRTS